MAVQLADLKRQAAQVGFNLFGAVDAHRFDSCQPADRRLLRLQPRCGTVLVLGSGGREYWQHVQARNGKQGSGKGRPLQAYAVERIRDLAGGLQAGGIGCRVVLPERDRSVNFPQLAEAAGFGTVSPVIATLLHPDYGPWVSVHGAVLVEGAPFGPVADASVVDRFQPCCTCERPCLQACPVGAHDGEGNSSLHVCASHRHAGNCSDGCSVRRACPVGAEHRYEPAEEAARQAQRRAVLERQFGLGVWRFVPRFLRR